jgi:hypothetical protein
MILALSGRKQAGKNLIHRLIGAINLANSRLTTCCSWADPLKKLCVDILNLEPDQVYGDDAVKNSPVPHLLWENFPIQDARLIRNSHGMVTDLRRGPMTAREVMQYWGTDIFRTAYRQVWIDAGRREIERLCHEYPTICVINTDTRFPDEVAAIQAMGGKVLRLMRDSFRESHDSESALDRDRFDWNCFDAVLDNTVTDPVDTLRMAYPVLLDWGVVEPVADLDPFLRKVIHDSARG